MCLWLVIRTAFWCYFGRDVSTADTIFLLTLFSKMSQYTLGNTRVTLEVILGLPDLIQFTILGLHIQILTPNTHGWCYQGPMSLTDVHDLPRDCLWLLHSQASHSNSTIRIRLAQCSLQKTTLALLPLTAYWSLLSTAIYLYYQCVFSCFPLAAICFKLF